MSTRLFFRFGSAAALGVAVAVLVDRPEISSKFVGTIAAYSPSRMQNFFLRHRFPADYPRLRLHYPQDAVDLYFWGERKKSLHAVSELIDSGKFGFWLTDQPESREAIFCILLLAKQDPQTWKKVLAILSEFRASETFKEVPLEGKFREAMRDGDWEEISILCKSGFLAADFVRFQIPAAIWASVAILVSLV